MVHCVSVMSAHDQNWSCAISPCVCVVVE